MKNDNNEQVLNGLIKAALDAESQLRYLLSNQFIKGNTTRAPLEKLVACIQSYRQLI